MGIRSSVFRCVLFKYLYTLLCSHIHLRACIFSSAMAEPRWSPTQGWLFVVQPYSLFEVHFPRSFATLVIESSYSLLPLASLQVFSSWPWYIDSGVAIQCTFSSLMAEPRWSLTRVAIFFLTTPATSRRPGRRPFLGEAEYFCGAKICERSEPECRRQNFKT